MSLPPDSSSIPTSSSVPTGRGPRRERQRREHRVSAPAHSGAQRALGVCLDSAELGRTVATGWENHETGAPAEETRSALWKEDTENSGVAQEPAAVQNGPRRGSAGVWVGNRHRTRILHRQIPPTQPDLNWHHQIPPAQPDLNWHHQIPPAQRDLNSHSQIHQHYPVHGGCAGKPAPQSWAGVPAVPVELDRGSSRARGAGPGFQPCPWSWAGVPAVPVELDRGSSRARGAGPGFQPCPWSWAGVPAVPVELGRGSSCVRGAGPGFQLCPWSWAGVPAVPVELVGIRSASCGSRDVRGENTEP
ncbi:uncharacterized protein LOC135578773 [Columba livia]|uniref:uncharacterized protein LOC135578773 n=1 Tax=Columba livia TaxID=8932 RepID=UPI0031B9E3D7